MKKAKEMSDVLNGLKLLRPRVTEQDGEMLLDVAIAALGWVLDLREGCDEGWKECVYLAKAANRAHKEKHGAST